MVLKELRWLRHNNNNKNHLVESSWLIKKYHSTSLRYLHSFWMISLKRWNINIFTRPSWVLSFIYPQWKKPTHLIQKGLLLLTVKFKWNKHNLILSLVITFSLHFVKKKCSCALDRRVQSFWQTKGVSGSERSQNKRNVFAIVRKQGHMSPMCPVFILYLSLTCDQQVNATVS